MQSLPNPMIRSESLGISVRKTTAFEAQSLSLEVAALPPPRALGFPTQCRRFYLLYIYPLLIPRLQRSINLKLVRAAVRTPLLERLLPTVRKLAMWGALRDRVRLESGEALSASELQSAVRLLRTYRDKYNSLTRMTPNI